MCDVTICDHGSIVMFAMNSDAAFDWADDHLGDDAIWLGNMVACEPRYAPEIADAMVDDGLTIAGRN